MEKNEILELVLIILGGVFLLLFLIPFLGFWLGYFQGWLAKIIIGRSLTGAINTVFGTHITAAMLPKIGGVLGWVSTFFMSGSGIKNNKKEKK